MKTYAIATIPGDGIGKEVVPAGQQVLLQEVQGVAGVEDILDQQHRPPGNLAANVGEQRDVPRCRCPGPVVRGRDEVDGVGDGDPSGKVGEEDEGSPQHADKEQRLLAVEVP